MCVILIWTNKDLHFPRVLYGLWSQCLLCSNSITLLELKRKKTDPKKNRIIFQSCFIFIRNSTLAFSFFYIEIPQLSQASKGNIFFFFLFAKQFRKHLWFAFSVLSFLTALHSLGRPTGVCLILLLGKSSSQRWKPNKIFLKQ